MESTSNNKWEILNRWMLKHSTYKIRLVTLESHLIIDPVIKNYNVSSDQIAYLIQLKKIYNINDFAGKKFI
jgi:hypothetical protein